MAQAWLASNMIVVNKNTTMTTMIHVRPAFWRNWICTLHDMQKQLHFVGLTTITTTQKIQAKEVKNVVSAAA